MSSVSSGSSVLGPHAARASAAKMTMRRVRLCMASVLASGSGSGPDGALEVRACLFEIGERAGLPVEISHHKASGRANWGKVRDSLAMIDDALAGELEEEARDWGMDVLVEVVRSGLVESRLVHLLDLPEDVLAMLNDMGINVVESEEAE